LPDLTDLRAKRSGSRKPRHRLHCPTCPTCPTCLRTYGWLQEPCIPIHARTPERSG